MMLATLRPGHVLHIWRDGAELAAVPLSPAAAQSLAPDERRLAGMVIDKIDDAIEGLGEGGAAMKAARETWGRLRRMETIETAIERAGLSPSGFAQALQSACRALLKSPRKLRGFSSAERAAIVRVARGGPVTRACKRWARPSRQADRLGPCWPVARPMVSAPVRWPCLQPAWRQPGLPKSWQSALGGGVAESVGSSDARRAVVEALARQTNALAFMAPAAAPIVNALAPRWSVPRQDRRSIA